MLSGKHIVLGVTGGIAAYKAAEIVSRLGKLGASVDVIMTKNATEFVAPLTFETLSHNPVTIDTFARPERWEVEHVALAKKAELFIVAPLTANMLAKMACGIADDMLSTTLLATKAPLLLAPAMNTGMWTNEATQKNVEIMKKRGARFIGPDSGSLACGDVGSGRMSEPEQIVAIACEMLTRSMDLKGLTVMVTAGPTRERLDPVRYMTNDSSGKMGYAIAMAAQERGARVTLVTGPVALPVPDGVDAVPVETTKELYDAAMRLCDTQDVIIQAAAPADYRFETISQQKMKKRGGEPMTLTLIENPDVAKAVGAKKREGQTLVGFAAETNDLIANARGKLQKKNLDLVVANDVTQAGAGFGVDTNIVTLITQNGESALPLMSKAAVAHQILDAVLALRHARA